MYRNVNSQLQLTPVPDRTDGRTYRLRLLALEHTFK